MSQTVEPSPTPQYTGEIATFDFRDLDLQDFFRLIGDISGLNVVLDPSVSGTATLLLRAVPWDQALDVVLRNNSLGYELEGNILRVATRATLQAEEDAARLLREAQALNAPLMTETYILSYTQSATVSAIVQDLLSPRGTIITDARRNALIITDIPSQFGRVGPLMSFLDTPSQQVEIEARLLSASKSFSRDLGVQIGRCRSASCGIRNRVREPRMEPSVSRRNQDIRLRDMGTERITFALTYFLASWKRVPAPGSVRRVHTAS